MSTLRTKIKHLANSKFKMWLIGKHRQNISTNVATLDCV